MTPSRRLAQARARLRTRARRCPLTGRAARYHAAAIREMARAVPRWWELPAVERYEMALELAEIMALSDRGAR